MKIGHIGSQGAMKHLVAQLLILKLQDDLSKKVEEPPITIDYSKFPQPDLSDIIKPIVPVALNRRARRRLMRK